LARERYARRSMTQRLHDPFSELDNNVLLGCIVGEVFGKLPRRRYKIAP